MVTRCGLRFIALGDDEMGMHGKLNVRSLSNFWVTLSLTTIHIFLSILEPLFRYRWCSLHMSYCCLLFWYSQVDHAFLSIDFTVYLKLHTRIEDKDERVAGVTCSLVAILFQFISINLQSRRKTQIRCSLHAQGLSMCLTARCMLGETGVLLLEVIRNDSHVTNSSRTPWSP
jgi:hypothetical protein